MITRDFHGWKLEDAENEIHVIVGEIRLSKQPMTIELITGHGPIRKSAIAILESYGLIAEPQWGNEGVICALIE
ncbi:MAG TPA: hypothetical protein VFM18_19415 [Methanosarcina sp.]|nr:hypothetical protein [Methanosarcina sp.]